MKNPDRIRVLYAEDNEDACLMLSTLPRFSAIDVSPAHTVEAAFRSAQNDPYDLYLLDSRFPDGSGFELCRRLRKRVPQMPVVFYSGEAYATDQQKGLAAGADRYLVKPNCDSIAETILALTKRPAF